MDAGIDSGKSDEGYICIEIRPERIGSVCHNVRRQQDCVQLVCDRSNAARVLLDLALNVAYETDCEAEINDIMREALDE